MKRAAALVALVLVAGACDDGSIELRGTGGGQTPRTFTFVEEGGGGGTVRPAPGGGGASGGGGRGGQSDGETPSEGGEPVPGQAPPPVQGGGAGGGSSGGPSPSPASIDDRARLGSMGPALLRPAIDEAVVEIDASPGESLTNAARNALVGRLGEHGGKDVGLAPGSELPEQDVYTTEELRALMAEHRATWSDDDRVGVYVMVLSGRHENEGVVGVSFSASAFAIFTEQLGGGLLGLNYSTYEEAVVVHELGHLFGLVNLSGHGAFHEDPSHPGHSANQGSVMFWAVESTVVGDVFEGGPPRQFDADDLEEMERIRAS